MEDKDYFKMDNSDKVASAVADKQISSITSQSDESGSSQDNL